MAIYNRQRHALWLAAGVFFLLSLTTSLSVSHDALAAPFIATDGRLPDRIVLRKGGMVECQVVSISSDVLYFMRPDQDLEQVPVADVLRVEFGGPVPATPTAPAAPAASPTTAQVAPTPAPPTPSQPVPPVPAAPKPPQPEAPTVDAAPTPAPAPVATPDTASKPAKGNAVIPTATPTASWKDVKVTKDSAECRGMLYVDKYDVTLTQSRNLGRMTSDDLETAAIMQLQKKAVQRRATLLYVRKVEFIRAYGEPPSIHINAAAYKPNPHR